MTDQRHKTCPCNKQVFKQGFVALISMLIVAAVLEGAALATSLALSLTGESIRDSQNSMQTILNSASCQEIESLRLATDPDYAGNEIITLPSGTCTTAPIN